MASGVRFTLTFISFLMTLANSGVPGEPSVLKGPECPPRLAKSDRHKLSVVVTDSSIVIRHLISPNCKMAEGFECGRPPPTNDQMSKQDNEKDPYEDEDDEDAAKPGDEDGKIEPPPPGCNGTNNPPPGGMGQEPPPPGSDGDHDDGTGPKPPPRGCNSTGMGPPPPEGPGKMEDGGLDTCLRFSKRTVLRFAEFERLDSNMQVLHTSPFTAIKLEQDDDSSSGEADIPHSRVDSSSDNQPTPVRGGYATAIVVFSGGAMCKIKMFSVGSNGKYMLDDVQVPIEKGDFMFSLNVTDTSQWFCWDENEECASYVRIRMSISGEGEEMGGQRKPPTKVEELQCQNEDGICGKRLSNVDGSSMSILKQVVDDMNTVVVEEDGDVTIDLAFSESFSVDLLIKPTLEEDMETNSMRKISCSQLVLICGTLLTLVFMI